MQAIRSRMIQNILKKKWLKWAYTHLRSHMIKDSDIWLPHVYVISSLITVIVKSRRTNTSNLLPKHCPIHSCNYTSRMRLADCCATTLIYRGASTENNGKD